MPSLSLQSTQEGEESGSFGHFSCICAPENRDYQSDCSPALITIVSARVYKHTLVMTAELHSDW